MSSLRLALKQSLQESGGGTFSSGHGEKKKRKKKKSNSSSNGPSGNAKKGRREGEASKRKRGRPRKHPRSQRENVDEDNELSSSMLPQRDRTQRLKIEDEEEDDDFYSENEFSYDSGGDYDDDDDGSDDDDDTEDGSPYRSRSQNSGDEEGDEEGELDEGMHSDEDDPNGAGPSKGKGSEKPLPMESNTEKTVTNFKQAMEAEITEEQAAKEASSELKSALSEFSGTTANAEEEEMLRKKLKLQKLKKKLEKNKSQDSAASKIQSQWKKKKNKFSPESKEKQTTAVATNNSIPFTTAIEKDKAEESKGNTESKSPKSEPENVGPSKADSEAMESQQKPLQDKAETTSTDGDKVENVVFNKDVFSGSVSKPLESSTTAGDRVSTKSEDGEEKAAKAKKHGYVPAPTKEVKDWKASMSDKKSRKHIRVGMRVKVRFGIPVKNKDGTMKQKKKFYGGKVVAISKKCNKIRIKYDDGTSEVSKFPDKDVYVDAVGNGEHAVPADKFIPPPFEDEPDDAVETNEISAPAVKEQQEEGEIATPKTEAAPVSKETEEGEVQEDTKPKARSLDPSKACDSKKNGPNKSSDDITALSSEPAEPKPPMDVPSTPPSKKEKTDVEGAAKEDVQMDHAPSPSQEEGELSPGITVPKSSENGTVEEQKDESASSVPKESIPLPPKALLSSNTANEKAAAEPMKFSADPPVTPKTTSGDSSNADEEKGNEEAVASDAPSKPKKLSIRIPSNSLATIKSLSSPKAGGSKSPVPPSSSSKVVTEVNKVDDVLKDTPEAKNEVSAKRKRTSDEDVDAIAPSLDVVSSDPEPPPKRRIKVAIGKNLLDAAASSRNPETSEAVAPKESEMVVEEQELAPIAEETISAGESKKKKKRADRAKSPRPKSPLSVPGPDTIKSKTISNSSETSSAVTPKQQKIGSKGSAFSAKKSTKEDSAVTGQNEESIAAELIDASVSLRIGRKAAEEAKEKLSVKQKAKLNAKEAKEEKAALLESSKKKKKRRREMEVEEQEEEVEIEPSELEWVQCDRCQKWRVLPDNIKAASLSDKWYCEMNLWDPKRNNCDAPAQNLKQLKREFKKKARKRQKREAELAELQQEKATKKNKQQEEEIVAKMKKKTKQEKLQAGVSTPRSVSPKPTKSAKSSGGKSKESAAETKRAEAKRALEGGKKSKVIGEDTPNQTDSGSDTQKEVKKKGKKGKKESQDNENQDDDGRKGGRKRGRPSRNQTTGTPVPTSSSANNGGDEDNVEWVQCDKCEKWRKLPPHISADELPDVWNCTMNTWNPHAASCDVAEDKADAHHQEVGAAEWQLRQAHAGKYSYRQMIFGTGARKHNRPMSERSRAAESLFIQPVTSDSEQPYPTTQYSKSSAFLPRLTNFDKRNAIEGNTIGIFDVLRHSNLWEDLRTVDMKPSKVLSSSSSGLNIPGQKLKTYDGLSDEVKNAMQDVVLQTLEFGCLTGHEITGKAQWFPYETSIKGVAGIRGYCNEDIILHTLLDLVRDGLVEMATVRDPFRPVSEWVPRFRRVGTRRAFEAVEAIKASRCMKIAKPWKQRPSTNTSTTEWVTGQRSS